MIPDRHRSLGNALNWRQAGTRERRRRSPLDSFAKRVGLPIVFTEIGYKSTKDTAVEPWVWPERGRFFRDPLARWYSGRER